MSLHTLTRDELRISAELTAKLGLSMYVYNDGSWIAETAFRKEIGVGSTPEQAARDLIRALFAAIVLPETMPSHVHVSDHCYESVRNAIIAGD